MALEDLVAATTAMNDLTAEVAGKMGLIDDKVDAATASVPDVLNRIWYVNQNTGDDANDGSIGAPFKTFAPGISKEAHGGNYKYTLQSDFTVDKIYTHNGSSVIIQSDIGPTNRKLIYAAEIDGATSHSPGFALSQGGNIQFHDIHFRSITLSGHVTNGGMMRALLPVYIRLWRCEFEFPAGSDLTLLGNLGYYTLYFQSVTIPAEMPGMYMEGISAGTDPRTLDAILGGNVATF